MFSKLFKSNKNPEIKTEDPQSETSDSQTASTVLDGDKIKALIVDLTHSETIFTQAGFVMEQLEIELGEIPKVTPQFKQLKDISSEQENELLASLSEKKLLQFVLISLFKTSKMKSLVEDSNMNYYGVQIDITASPSVKTIFKRTLPNQL